MRWRQALAAVLGAVAVGAALIGGLQALGEARVVGGVQGPPPVSTVGSDLPGASDPDAVVPPAGAVERPPGFAPSAVVPVPLPTPRRGPDTGSGSDAGPDAGAGPDPSAGSPPSSRPAPRTTAPSPRPGGRHSREPTSGESQYEYGCRRGYITEGC